MVVSTSLGTTAQTDLLGGPVTIGSIFISNGSGTAFLKIYDDPSPTIGTTEPDLIIEVAGSKTVNWWIDGGLTLVNGLSVCASDTPGKAAGSNPTTFNLRLGLSGT